MKNYAIKFLKKISQLEMRKKKLEDKKSNWTDW